jgi:hypothetical protein
MAAIMIGGVKVEAPSEYSVKMVVFTAPMKSANKPGTSPRFLQKERNFLRNLVVAREDLPAGTSLDDYCAKQVEVLSVQIPGYKRIKNDRIQIAGVSCPVVESQGAGPEGLALSTITTFYANSDTVWTISASNLTGIQFQDTRPEYLEIMKSFQVIE